ncbi:hypothetical protein DPMN_019261 [Dreissena polymorpha]|uniref:Uncharacterized protein n=1 Tax=Dreissena polymorpha TaxID=45954 RepID=A0A9D4NI29_DREPO|nr:hypothetical protein DPMN_044178 [Dreissena polymorpha]KAH3895101.1 hypothetical protein DPMN_019261 [Dreissena polymorpha]
MLWNSVGLGITQKADVCSSHKHPWGKKHKDRFDERTLSSYWMRNTTFTKPTSQTPSP